jgi:hypothetical protein
MIPMTFSMLLTVHGPSNLTCSEHNFWYLKGLYHESLCYHSNLSRVYNYST